MSETERNEKTLTKLQHNCNLSLHVDGRRKSENFSDTAHRLFNFTNINTDKRLLS